MIRCNYVARRTGNVTRWRNQEMVERWVASVLRFYAENKLIGNGCSRALFILGPQQ